jgi:hypothetical protein
MWKTPSGPQGRRNVSVDDSAKLGRDAERASVHHVSRYQSSFAYRQSKRGGCHAGIQYNRAKNTGPRGAEIPPQKSFPQHCPSITAIYGGFLPEYAKNTEYTICTNCRPSWKRTPSRILRKFACRRAERLSCLFWRLAPPTDRSASAWEWAWRRSQAH